MKAENLLMPQGAVPTGKTPSLRSAVQSKTAAQSAKAGRNDFGSALDKAKNAQKDAKAEPEKAAKAEARDTRPEPKDADAKAADVKDADAKAADVKDADAKAADVKDTDAKATDVEDTDAKATGAEDADAKAAGAEDSDAKATDARDVDAKATDAKAADAKATDAKAADAKATDDVKFADVKTTDVKDIDAKTIDAGNVDVKPGNAEVSNADAKETGDVEMKAPEPAAELPKNGEKAKTPKTEDGKAADEAQNAPETAQAATTLNAMLMAMAQSAQTQAPVETQPTAAMPETADALSEAKVIPEPAVAGSESMAVLEPDAAMTEKMAMPETGTSARNFAMGNLDALLPQDPAKEQQAAQNQQLMDMLSSENSAGARLVSQALPKFSTEVQEVAAPTKMAVQQPVLDEMQLSPQTQTEGPSIKMGETILEQPVQSVQPESTAAVLQNTVQSEPTVRDVRTTKNERPDNGTSLFAGVPLTVEDAVLDRMQNPRQNLGDMLNRQPQQQSQQPNTALNEAVRGSNGGEMESAQAAERGESQPGAQQTQSQMTGAGVIPQGMSFAETMNAAAPVEAAPVQQAQDPYNVMQQIVDQARLIRSDANTEMVIRLNPEHLGELTLRVAVTASGAINATFHTENAQVRGLLESSMIQLKQELQQQGLKVNNVDVQSGLSQDFFAQSQAGQQGYPQPQHSARNQAADRRSFENDADALTVNTAVSGAAETESTANVDGSDGVNYLV